MTTTLLLSALALLFAAILCAAQTFRLIGIALEADKPFVPTVAFLLLGLVGALFFYNGVGLLIASRLYSALPTGASP